ncbi:MAG: MFS transporter [Phycisphaerales bacterium]|nr:MFS transporter [Phycisphaerales bacterium]
MESQIAKIDHPEPMIHHGRRRWGALVMVCLAVTVIVMDGSIVNVALPTLIKTLDGTSNSQLQWIVDAYILSFAVLLLTSGSSADRFGRRRLLMIGLTIFAAVSVGAAFSKSATQLIFWRAAMGVGAAMIFPATLAILTDAFPEPRLRRMAIAMWAGCSGLGVAIGPVAGGWLLTHYHWGSIFFINVPLIAVTLLGGALCIKESRDPEHPAFDFVGNALAILGLIALIWGLIEGPELGWLSPKILASLASAAVLLTGFLIWESKVKSPMLDIRLFRNRQFAGGCIAITTAFFGLFGFVFMVTQFFQFIYGYDALGAGLRTLPFAGFIVLGSGVADRFGAFFGARLISPAGLVLMGFGFLLVTQDTAQTPYLTLVYQMGFLGVGLGMVNASATNSIMSALPSAKAGVGSSVNDTARELGGTLGVAIMGSLFNVVYRSDITSGFEGSPIPVEAQETLRDSVGMAMGVIDQMNQTAGPIAAQAVRTPVQDAFIGGFHASSLLAGIAALLGGVAVFFFLPPNSHTTEEQCSDQGSHDPDPQQITSGQSVVNRTRSEQL